MDENWGFPNVGPGRDVKGKLGHMHRIQLHKGSHLGKGLIQDVAIEFDIADLALAIEEVCVDLLFAKVNDELIYDWCYR
jgi:hypothetical protein